MATDDAADHPASGSTGSRVLGAAGEAAAFIAGAPIAGAADAAIVLGDVVAEREAELEEAITGRHEPGPPPARAKRPLLWLVLAALLIAVLIWLFRA
jgi:hypothetical protein